MSEGAKHGEYNHGEAYMLMEYVDKVTGETEILWNSRDGVTPFIISSRDGKSTMVHKDWTKDRRVKDHVPKPGDRIFVDAQLHHVLPVAREYVRAHWADGEYPMMCHPLFGQMGKLEAIGYYAAKMLEPSGTPWVEVVK